MVQPIQKWSLRILGAAGFAIFASFFALTFHTPEWVETFAIGFIEQEVSKNIDGRIDAVEPPSGESALARIAQSIYSQNEEEITELKERLKDNVHEEFADALAQIRELDCLCREMYVQLAEARYETDIVALQIANEKIVELIQSEYMKVVAELKRDVRIFTGSNALVFLLLVFVSITKPRAISHLFLPAALLMLSTLICSYFYIFEQNWLLNIIYSNYLGFLYLGYVGLVFLFLCDIIFNRARATTEIINIFLNAIGSALSVVPC